MVPSVPAHAPLTSGTASSCPHPRPVALRFKSSLASTGDLYLGPKLALWTAGTVPSLVQASGPHLHNGARGQSRSPPPLHAATPGRAPGVRSPTPGASPKRAWGKLRGCRGGIGLTLCPRKFNIFKSKSRRLYNNVNELSDT